MAPLSRPHSRAAVSEIPLAPRRARLLQRPAADPVVAEEEPAVPSHFLCPISLEMMRDPVTGPTGITYDRSSVEGWLVDHGRATCPVTARPMRAEELVPNHAARRAIQDWCVANRGAEERVPTPRAPVSAADAAELLAGVAAAARRGDAAACRRLAAKARALGKESERNRRCLAGGGAARALSSAFAHLVVDHPTATALTGTASGALDELLTALVVFFPLNEESRRRIASPASLRAIVSILSSRGDAAAARVSAAVVLREVASSSDTECLDAMHKTEGTYDALVTLLRHPVSPQATKAALVTAYYLVTANSSDTTTAACHRFVELGAVRLLVELLVDSDRGTTEKALAALDGLLRTERGRGAARAHVLAVPVLVRRLQHVSDMATEFAVSALWRLLCKDLSGEGEGGRRCCCKAAEEEALQAGAFQKLLLLLQVGCAGVTKDRASDLLRMLNGSRGSVECIETVDFKGLKRPF